MGDIGIGLVTSVGWHPAFPFKDTLTGMSCQELADEYEQMTGRQWATPIQQYPKFEWAIDILKRATNVDDPEALLAALTTTKMSTVIGPIDLTTPVKLGTDHPVVNAYRPQFPAGQWRKGTKHKYDLFIVSNAGAPLVTPQDAVQEMVYS